MTRNVRLAIGGAVGILLFVIFMLLIFWAIGRGANDEIIELEFWGAYDDVSLFRDAIDAFTRDHSNIKITYKVFPFGEYERALVNAWADGAGPDVWMMHNTWLPKHISRIEPMPTEKLKGYDAPLMLFKDFQLQFVDVAVRDLTASGTIFAVPLYVDTLALYYNKDILNANGITTPPRTWEEFNAYVPILTSRDEANNITKSAAALGTARNVNRSTDILMMLMLQTGTRMTNDSNTSATFSDAVQGISTGANALRYYTDFANKLKNDVYTWDDQQSYSIDAFAQGKTAMMFNYSHHIGTIRSRSARFNFGIAPVPQPQDSAIQVTFANYWAPTVSKLSEHTDEAWEFLTYLSSYQGSKQYVNLSGRPSARRDIIEEQKNHPDLGVFALQALTARSWYQIDNVAIETIFAEMIDNVNFNKKSIGDALDAADREVNVIMSK